MKHIWIVCLLFLCSSEMGAQGKMVLSGVISSADGASLKDVQVGIVYTRTSTKVNKKGEFSLKGVLPGDTIQLVWAKEKEAQFAAGNHPVIRLEIASQVMTVFYADGQIAVIPFLELSPEETKRAGTVVTARMIERNNYRTLEQALKEMIPGLLFQREDGVTTVVMRGTNSLKVSSSSLVLVDGAETSFQDADNSLNMNDIELIEVHKDGMGYGIKGSGGVIVIRTKGNIMR